MTNKKFTDSITLRNITHSDCVFDIPQMKHGMPILYDAASIANLIDIRLHKFFFATVYPNNQYKTFNISKKRDVHKLVNGQVISSEGYRTIHAPSGLMKGILRGLKTCIFDKYPLPSYITGFRKGLSCIETARRHQHGETLISMDISNAFPSTRASTIRNMLCDFGMLWPIANAIASACTINNKLLIPIPKKECEKKGYPLGTVREIKARSLPQGSPASPVLFNLVAAETFGPELDVYCKERNLVLTVYADDVTISTKKGEPALSMKDSYQIVNEVGAIIKKHKYMVKHEKTKIMQKKSVRQTVMGVTVNDGMHVPAKYSKFKGILHRVACNGILAEAIVWMDHIIDHSFSKSLSEKDAIEKLKFLGFVDSNDRVITSVDNLPTSEVKVSSFVYWLRGNINWIQQVDPNKGELLSDSMKAIYASWKLEKGLKSELTEGNNRPLSYYHNDNPQVEAGQTDQLLEGFYEDHEFAERALAEF